MIRHAFALSDRLAAIVDSLLPTLARLVFSGVLLGYFWSSALTKFDGSPFALSSGAFVQIYPKAMEAVGYDNGQLGLLAHLVVLAGTWAEVILPLLVLVGLATRLAALGMIGFVAVQTLTDVFGHNAAFGGWFDRVPDALADQRGLWVFLLVVIAAKGAGPLSADRFARQWVSGRRAISARNPPNAHIAMGNMVNTPKPNAK